MVKKNMKKKGVGEKKTTNAHGYILSILVQLNIANRVAYNYETACNWSNQSKLFAKRFHIIYTTHLPAVSLFFIFPQYLCDSYVTDYNKSFAYLAV